MHRIINKIEKQKMIDFLDKKEQDNLKTGIKLANKYLWGLSNFKKFIAQFLKTKNDWISIHIIDNKYLLNKIILYH